MVRRIEIYVDGSGTGRICVATELKYFTVMTPAKTHNEAEYWAIIYALEMISTYELVTIYSDSQLVVRQLNGEYAVKNERLRELHRKVWEIIFRRGLDVKFVWIPREKNLAGALLDSELRRR